MHSARGNANRPPGPDQAAPALANSAQREPHRRYFDHAVTKPTWRKPSSLDIKRYESRVQQGLTRPRERTRYPNYHGLTEARRERIPREFRGRSRPRLVAQGFRHSDIQLVFEVFVYLTGDCVSTFRQFCHE